MRPGAHVFQIYRTGNDDLLRWRMISSNGRTLGCSPEPLQSVAEARAAIARIVDSADDLVANLRLTHDHRWLWTLSLDQQAVVRGAVAHDRHLRCELAWQRFVLAAPLAQMEDEVHAFRDGSSAGGPESVPRSSRRGLQAVDPSET